MVLGVIITFNPDLKRLLQNIDASIVQVNELIIVDNCSDNLIEIEKICKNKKINLLKSLENKGIANALSRALEYAFLRNYEYIFTLDQDSISHKKIIKNLMKGFDIQENVAICAPQILPIEGGDERQLVLNKEVVVVGRCPTSGSLCCVKKLRDVGGFNDELFIDEVDHDICYRLEKKGYKILKLNSTYILHEVGEPQVRRFIFKKIIISNHNELRLYYIARNCMYINKEFRLLSDVKKRRIKLELARRAMKIILYEKNKVSKLRSMGRGILDSKTFTTKFSDKLR